MTDDDLKALWLGAKHNKMTFATVASFEEYLQRQEGVKLSESQRKIITLALAKEGQQDLGPRNAGLPSRPRSRPDNHVRIGPRGPQSSGYDGAKPGTPPPSHAKPHGSRDLWQGGLTASPLDRMSSASTDSRDPGTERLKQILNASFSTTKMTLNTAVEELNQSHGLYLGEKQASLVRDHLQSKKLLLPPDMK